MKKSYFLISAVVLSSAIAAILFYPSHKNETEREREEMGAPNEANERLEWELRRLADPSGKIPDHIREKELAFAATLPTDAMMSSRMSSSPSWVARGPWNLGGRTRALGIDISNESNILAGSASGGMWRSTDGGTTWSPTTAWTEQLSVSCLAQDTRSGHTSTWYYGSGEGYGASASGGGAYYLGNGMYKSTDGGATWTSLTSTATNTPHTFESFWDITWNVAIDPSETVNDELYVATLGAVYRSTNGGTSWTAVRGGNLSSYSYFTDVQVTPSGVVYATLSDDGPNKGIWRSTDGINFTNITPSNFPSAYNRIVIGVAPSDENQVWFLANTPGFGQPDTNFVGDIEWNSLWKYNYLSGNGDSTGGAWSDRSLSLPTTGGMFDKYTCQGSYDMVVKVKPDDTSTVFIGGTNLYRSTNGFIDDTQTTFIGGYLQGSALPVIASYLNHHPDQHAFVFYPSDAKKVLSGNDGGVFKTNDCMQSTVAWTPLNNGYLTSMFYTVAVDHAAPGNNIVIGGAQDNGSWWTNSANPTAVWTQPRGGDGSFCAIADNQAAYYFSIQNGKMMKATLDATGNVTNFARIDPIGGKNYLFINPFILDPNNNNIMYLAGGKHLWRNNDLSGIPYASNWDSISTNWVKFIDSVPSPATQITALAVSKSPANRLYYGTDKKKIFRVDNANVGTPSRVDITYTGFPASGYVNCIAVDPNDADKVMVVFSNYGVYSLWYSTDAGATWAKVAGNLEQNTAGTGNGPSIRWASILPVPGGNAYLVATSVGVFGTDTLNSTSTNWIQLGASTIGNAVCDMIDVREADGLVVIATHSHGIYSANITSLYDVGLGLNEQPKQDMMLTNYPNPFSSSTTIEYTLAKRAKVSVEILDELGRSVKMLQNSDMAAGKHSLSLDRAGLAAGTYYCRLVTGDAVETRKMLIIQ